MSDPNNIVLHDRRLVLMMICKAANTSLKSALTDVLRLPQRVDLVMPNPTCRDALMLREQGYAIATAIRHPLARLASCWTDKVSGRGPGGYHRPLTRKYASAGYREGMPFDAFVRFVASVPDEASDQHFRSMSWDIVCGGRIVPELVARVECPTWWDTLRDFITSRSQLDIGPARMDNQTSTKWRDMYDAETWRVACERYGEDLQRFCYSAVPGEEMDSCLTS